MATDSKSELFNGDDNVIDLVSSDGEEQTHGSINDEQCQAKHANSGLSNGTVISSPLSPSSSSSFAHGKRRRQEVLTIAYKSTGGALYNKNHRTNTSSESEEEGSDPARDNHNQQASPQAEDQQEQIEVSSNSSFVDEKETTTVAAAAAAALVPDDPCSLLAHHLPSQPVMLMAFIDSSADGNNDDAVITEGLLSLVDQLQLPHLVSCSGYRPPNQNITKEQTLTLIERLQHQPTTQHKRQNLCSVLNHIQQTDKWSCGFRNLQMLLSALLPHLSPDHPYFYGDIPPSLRRVDSNPECIVTPIPCLRQLQTFLEQSWADGFDKQGAKHYNRRIVGRKSEIGAVEVSSCLAFLSIDSVVLQFIKCKESRSLLGEFCWAYFTKQRTMPSSSAGTKWGGSTTGYCCFCCKSSNEDSLDSTYAHASDLLRVAESSSSSSFFAGNKICQPRKTATTYCTCSCPTFPLYLQWEGHSITIVGVEKHKKANGGDDVTLLVFDPMVNGPKLKDDVQRTLKETNSSTGYQGATVARVSRIGKLPPSMRLSSNKLLSKDCQILMCSIRPLTSKEKNVSRDRVNAVTAAKAAVVKSLQR